jgi:hypothetical protein
MIVSHEHKFIFVHLKRTSGRAIQGALMPFLGPDDIATPVDDPNSPESFPGRNCEGLGRHATAREIRDYVGGDVWNEYFTFAMERNPWDKTLSRYWASVSKGRSYEALVSKITRKRIGFEHWLNVERLKGKLQAKKHLHLPRHFGCYTDEHGEVMVDFIARFENRNEHLAELGRRMGVPIDGEVEVGTKTRGEKKKPYTEFFDKPWMRTLIENVFAEDLALLGYRFGEPHPQNWIERESVATG